MKDWKPAAALGLTVIFGVWEAGEIIRLAHSCWIQEQVCNNEPIVLPHATESLSFTVGSTST